MFKYIHSTLNKHTSQSTLIKNMNISLILEISILAHVVLVDYLVNILRPVLLQS